MYLPYFLKTLTCWIYRTPSLQHPSTPSFLRLCQHVFHPSSCSVGSTRWKIRSGGLLYSLLSYWVTPYFLHEMRKTETLAISHSVFESVHQISVLIFLTQCLILEGTKVHASPRESLFEAERFIRRPSDPAVARCAARSRGCNHTLCRQPATVCCAGASVSLWAHMCLRAFPWKQRRKGEQSEKPQQMRRMVLFVYDAQRSRKN